MPRMPMCPFHMLTTSRLHTWLNQKGITWELMGGGGINGFSLLWSLFIAFPLLRGRNESVNSFHPEGTSKFNASSVSDSGNLLSNSWGSLKRCCGANSSSGPWIFPKLTQSLEKILLDQFTVVLKGLIPAVQSCSPSLGWKKVQREPPYFGGDPLKRRFSVYFSDLPGTRRHEAQ